MIPLELSGNPFVKKFYPRNSIIVVPVTKQAGWSGEQLDD